MRTLKLMARLAIMNKRVGNLVMHSPEFAALRLAQVDAGPTPSRYWARHRDSLLSSFEQNLTLLRKSWVLMKPMHHRLKNSPLGDLSTSKLIELRRHLKSGWAQEFAGPPRRGSNGEREPDLDVWITPSHRF